MIMVDEVVNNGTFGYTNKDGKVEFVKVFCGERITDFYVDDEDVSIYTEDIPKLIKALQAAKNYAESEA